LGADYEVEYIERQLNLREELLTQLRSEGGRLAVSAGLTPQAGELTRVLDPIVAQARRIARLKDPRGLYTYCWCQEPHLSVK